MNHCQVSADECRHAHTEGIQEARAERIDAHANEMVSQLQADLLSASKANNTPGYYNLKFSSNSLSLFQLITNELPEEVFGLAQDLVKQDMENFDEI